MLNLFNFLRFKRQAPTSRPPKGYYDLRISKANGKLVLVDEDGAETPVAITSQADGTITSADISDATSAAQTNPGLVLKSGADGVLGLKGLELDAGAGEDTGVILSDNSSGFSAVMSIASGSLGDDRAYALPNASGVMAVVPSYADESAANTALAANVVYYNVATGLFQITTA